MKCRRDNPEFETVRLIPVRTRVTRRVSAALVARAKADGMSLARTVSNLLEMALRLKS